MFHHYAATNGEDVFVGVNLRGDAIYRCSTMGGEPVRYAFEYVLTKCCGAAVTGSGSTTVCKGCYMPVAEDTTPVEVVGEVAWRHPDGLVAFRF